MKPIELAVQRHRVTTRAELFAGGNTVAEIRHALLRGKLDRIRPGVFWTVDALPEAHFDRLRELHSIQAVAAALANPTAMISHGSAAVLRDIPVLSIPTQPCLTVPANFVGDIAGCHLHRAQPIPAHWAQAAGYNVSGIDRLVVDIGREHGVRAGVVTADACLHRGVTTMARLESVVRRCHHWPGIRDVRTVLKLCDGRAESPLESLSRIDLTDLVPPCEPQVRIYDGRGFIARVDFLWAEGGVVGEADGMSKYVTREALRLEKLRQERLDRTGLIVVRWTDEDLRDIAGLAARINDAHRRASYPGRLREWRTERRSA